MIEPTDRQNEILDFIKAHQNEKGYSPTMKEIADKFEFQSTNGVRDHLHAMKKKNLINITPGVARSIVIL